MSFFLYQTEGVLVRGGGDVARASVQWFPFVVTALSCPCAALYCPPAAEQLSLPEMQLSESLSDRLSRPPVSLCLIYVTAIISASSTISSYCT